MLRSWLGVVSMLIVGVCHGAPEVQNVAQAGSTATTQPASRSEPWWQARHAQRVALTRTLRPRVIFVGDSITQGWEGPGLAIWEQRFAWLPAANLGFSGDRTQHVLWRLGAGRQTEGWSPGVAVLMIGTNNLATDSVNDIAAGVEAIVRLLRRQHPDTRVLLLAVFPRGERPDDAQRGALMAVNQRIRLLEDGKWVIYRDIGANFLNSDGTLSRVVMPDYLHLSSRGYEVWADAVEGEIKAMLRAP